MLHKCLFLWGGMGAYVFGVIDSQVLIAFFGALVALASTASLTISAVMNYRLKKIELAQHDNHENIKQIKRQTDGMRVALEAAEKAKGVKEGIVEGKAIEKQDAAEKAKTT